MFRKRTSCDIELFDGTIIPKGVNCKILKYGIIGLFRDMHYIELENGKKMYVTSKELEMNEGFIFKFIRRLQGNDK